MHHININSLIIVFLSLGFLPIEVINYPIPITTITLISPLAVLMIGISNSIESRLAIFSVFLALTITLTSSLYTSDYSPIFSYLSFFSPITGLFLALSLTYKPYIITRLIQLFWLPGLAIGAALFLNLVNYSGNVRGVIPVSSEMHGDFMASTALGSFYGLKLYAAFGVNSLAGICVAVAFLLLLSFNFQKSNVIKFVIIISLVSIIWYGASLGSRAFYLGMFSFCGFIVLGLRKQKLLSYIFATIVVIILASIFLQDARIHNTFQSLLDGDWKSFTSNRSELWLLFFSDVNLLFGTAFNPISFEEHGSNSYHLYIFTLIAKSGLIVTLPILTLFIKATKGKTFYIFGGWADLIIKSGCYSFFLQSLVWDIYAVQHYGHIAWFFLGLTLIGTKAKRLLIYSRSNNESHGDLQDNTITYISK